MTQWDLLFGLKEDWEWMLDANTEVARIKFTFLKDEKFKEDHGSFEDGYGVENPTQDSWVS